MIATMTKEGHHHFRTLDEEVWRRFEGGVVFDHPNKDYHPWLFWIKKDELEGGYCLSYSHWTDKPEEGFKEESCVLADEALFNGEADCFGSESEAFDALCRFHDRERTRSIIAKDAEALELFEELVSSIRSAETDPWHGLPQNWPWVWDCLENFADALGPKFAEVRKRLESWDGKPGPGVEVESESLTPPTSPVPTQPVETSPGASPGAGGKVKRGG